jgi:CheY-like chemotaxis protein
LEILIAEDEADIAISYKIAFEDKNHRVIVTDNGQRCLEVYNDKLQNIRYSIHSTANIQPFDIVILDHKMPGINGLDVAKEILTVNPHQRILFISAYTKDILEEAVANIEPLRQQEIELLQKPVTLQMLIDTVEDNLIYFELEKLDIDINVARAANFTHKQLVFMLDFLKKYYRKPHQKSYSQLDPSGVTRF